MIERQIGETIEVKAMMHNSTIKTPAQNPDAPTAPLDGNPELERFQHICRYIEMHREEALPLATLSKMADLSPGYFQRRFKAIIGVSPKQYLDACRLGQLKQELRDGSNVTSAIYEAGFGSGSRVYEKLDTHLGMTPKQYRSGGKGLAISYACASSSLDRLMMAATDRGLCFIQFGPTEPALREALQREYPDAHLSAMPDDLKTQFEHWMQALELHLQGEKPHLDLPLDIQGTAFQLKVWHYLQKIPYGAVQSYAEVAAGIGQPTAARAVASACAANKLAIVIPCHRVIRGSGELGGYRWGLPMKRTLIDQEGINR
jgi:AraC family transcriptional regulator of adaptative response/methylated-DNA-[protein]-cysteine methyltransferase